MINPAHLHLMLTHIPIIGSIIATLIFIHAFFTKKEDVLYYSYYLFIIIGLASIIVYLTGDPSAEMVRNLSGTRVESIDEHENYALISFILFILTGVLSAYAVYLKEWKNAVPQWIKYTMIIISFISVISVGLTANSGGEIRHSEMSKTL